MSSKDKMIGAVLIIVGILFIAMGVMFGGTKTPQTTGNNNVYSESQNGQNTDLNGDMVNENNDIQVYSEEGNTQTPTDENSGDVNGTENEEENGRYIY